MEKRLNPPRLCSEIQLFDLCDRDVCAHKSGRFCTKSDILVQFEAIKEEDDRSPEQFLAEELDDAEGAGDMGYDESFAVDEYEDDEPDYEPDDET